MLNLPNPLTLAQACDALHALQADVRGAPAERVTVDASALVDFDSSALAVLLGGRRAALAAGKQFEVQGAPATLVALAGLYGVAELLSLPES